MEQGTLNLIVVATVILLIIIGISTLVLVARLYSRMAPRGWEEFLRNLVTNQEKITDAFQDLSKNREKERELLKHLVNATFSITEEIARIKNAKK
jgi:ABC-type siderophore export system fused ATPase/permease subunit